MDYNLEPKQNESLSESLLSLTETMYEFTKTLEQLVDCMDKAGMLKKGEQNENFQKN